MSTTRSVPVSLKLQGEPETQATALVEDWSAFDRFKRSVLLLCICWAAAGVCIFFPIVHFVLVPGFLVAGPAMLVYKLIESSTLQELKGPCPRCKKDGQFSVGGRFTAHRNVTCDGCGNLMELTAK